MCSEQPPRDRRVLVLEAWMGGSHANFLHAWRERSRHTFHVESLAPRHWKWRMSAAAWELARRLDGSAPRPDVLFVTDYVDLAQLAAFLPPSWARVPRIFYLHENQLTYPLSEASPAGNGGADTSWGFKNALSCLVADRVVFNSEFHRGEFASAADALLRRLPRPNPRAALARALERASVVWPGIEWERIPLGPGAPHGSPLRLLFNHRWEHDKDPDAFLDAVAELRARELAVEVVALGQGLEACTEGTRARIEDLKDTFLRRGFVDDRQEYLGLLGSCDLVVSTARHEFYGIAVLEALAAGCTPLVPDRLAYPEALGQDGRAEVFYRTPEELVERLAARARAPGSLRDPERRRALRDGVRSHAAQHTTLALDALVEEVADAGRPKPPRA